ncbi:MAG TPA: DapH/DapD/GlmU-related protein [Pirellulaceae bacterium]|mgnify:CR=1 FL=1|nr:DapH/DapD/GlmU-related protein [Pirellulaceae bacterium]HMO92969.1 DapH/DapD/GlmU-related protein [Pirellulaceae bacterium]HMP68466.1 DapH/DapD/GlmU-related protein [Pirellulaceae bacterium]
MQLIIFGDRTAAEMKAVADEVCGHQFDRIQTCVVDANLVGFENYCRDLKSAQIEIRYLIGLIDMQIRRRIEKACQQLSLEPWKLIHPQAYIAPSAQISPGCFVAPQASIGINAVIGDHSIIHFGASVGHDAQLGRHCAVLPGARISGNVCLGEGVLVGSNAFIFQGTQIGDEAKIDALTYVKEDVPKRRIVSVRRSGA